MNHRELRKTKLTVLKVSFVKSLGTTDIDSIQTRRIVMFEVSMNPQARVAFQRAHQERARVIKAGLDWLFGLKFLYTQRRGVSC